MISISNINLSVNVRSSSCLLTDLAKGIMEQLPPCTVPLRFSIVEVENDIFTTEISTLNWQGESSFSSTLADVELLHPRKRQHEREPFCVVQIIPTGIRCEIGGYAGDACPVTNLLAAAADYVVTHPNAVNASEINEMARNILYVEGRSLDDFLLGRIALAPTGSNRIGTIVDPTGQQFMDYVVNVLNAARTTAGIDCDLYSILDNPLNVGIEWSASGCAVGTVSDINSLRRGVENLLSKGAKAIGGMSVIHGVTQEMFEKHLAGLIPNPSGGIEAIITHLISKLYRIPTAHAPLPYYQALKGQNTTNPRAAAEFISTPHYFCVLKGLHRAPQLIPLAVNDALPVDCIGVENVRAVVAPADALGGVPALAAQFQNIPIVAVKENQTILNMTAERLKLSNVIEVNTYLEAAGVVLALRNGLSISSLKRPITNLINIDA